MRQEGVADGTTRRGYGTYIRASLSSVGKAILQNTRRMCTKALNQTLGAARTMGMSVNRRKGRVVQRYGVRGQGCLQTETATRRVFVKRSFASKLTMKLKA